MLYMKVIEICNQFGNLERLKPNDKKKNDIPVPYVQKLSSLFFIIYIVTADQQEVQFQQPELHYHQNKRFKKIKLPPIRLGTISAISSDESVSPAPSKVR